MKRILKRLTFTKQALGDALSIAATMVGLILMFTFFFLTGGETFTGKVGIGAGIAFVLITCAGEYLTVMKDCDTLVQGFYELDQRYGPKLPIKFYN